MAETLISRIKMLADVQADKTALAFKNDSLTYLDFDRKIHDVASRMSELGVERGDRVLFSALSKPEMAVLYLAIQYLGAVAVFIDKNVTPLNAVTIYKDADAKLFFTDKPMKGYENECNVYSLRQVYSERGSKEIPYVIPEEDELAELIYTSGTTGKPKGCMLTYKAVNSIWMNTVRGIGIRNDDVVLIPLPLNHSFALRVLRACLYVGATVVLQNGFTFAKDIESNLDKFSCTAVTIVPASVETIAKQMQDKFSEIMSRFRYIEVGAGALTIDQRKRLTKQLQSTVIYNTWGSSESGGALFFNVTDIAQNHPEKIAALGRPLDGISVRTLDENGNVFASDRTHPGRMSIRGDMQMAGYWNRPELTADTLRDGWLITGDMVYSDEDGYLYMLGRADDIINVGGEKVSPVEVENVAGEYENISECACIGVEDPEGILGNVPVLFVVGKNNKYSKDDLRHFLSLRLEKYKIPIKFIEVLELPRNAMQKINRRLLKEMWEKQGDDSLFNETIQTIMTRRSIRRFSDRPVDKELIETILKTGYYAPSGHNMQTWRFTVVTKKEEIERLKAAAEESAKANNVHFYGWDNPALLILVSNDNRNANGCQDASCAAENMMLAAWSFGIGSVWLNPLRTLRDKQPVKGVLDDFGIPENHTVWSTIAMGYPIADGVLLKKNYEVTRWIE